MGGLNIIIYKPYDHRQCCRLEGTIAHAQGTRGLLVFSLLDVRRTEPVYRESWQASADSLNVELNVICTYLCAGILFSMHTGRNSTHRSTLVYRASLAEKFDVISESPIIRTRDWSQKCLKRTCYFMPRRPNVVTWKDAKEECEKKNASLLSINTDSEWNAVNVFSRKSVIYIGLNTKVSRETYYLIREKQVV